ncbi:hypothetical protein [Synechocystis sp. FACHB-383]|nr:hypothetical protein [Synechocystis sp. FACHB-383]
MPSNIDPTESRALAGRTPVLISDQQELLAIAIMNKLQAAHKGQPP